MGTLGVVASSKSGGLALAARFPPPPPPAAAFRALARFFEDPCFDVRGAGVVFINREIRGALGCVGVYQKEWLLFLDTDTNTGRGLDG